MEKFRIITEYPNYSVSNLGSVKNNLTGRILKQCDDKDGYKIVRLSKDCKMKTIKVHRLVAFAFIPNPLNKNIIDHLNNLKDDNRIENLRWVTQQENCYNQSLKSCNTSGIKGVHWYKSNSKWGARITYNNKVIFLGLFENKEDAIIARSKKAQELFGEFINKCEVIKVKRKEIDEELEALEREFEELIKN